jgi:hypothetical protein
VPGDDVFGFELVVSLSGQYASDGDCENNERQKSSHFVYDGRRHDSFSPFSNGRFRNVKSYGIIRKFTVGARKNRVLLVTTPGSNESLIRDLRFRT